MIMNVFRAADAIEFVRAMDSCQGSPDVARAKMSHLNERIKAVEDRGCKVPSHILAAYRGYECVITPMTVIKLDDTLPD